MRLKLDANFCVLLSAFRSCEVRYLLAAGLSAFTLSLARHKISIFL